MERKYPERFLTKQIGDIKGVLVYIRPEDNPNNQRKIVLPRQLLNSTIRWFHQVTGYPGQDKLRKTLLARYYHPDMRRYVNN